MKDRNGAEHSEKNGQFVSNGTGEKEEYSNMPSAGKLAENYEKRFSKTDSVEDNTPIFGSQEELDELLGEEFKGVKGQAAVSKLLAEKRGHVKGAFHRDDIGDINLVWGNDFVGLKHIVQQREKQGINVQVFMQELSQVIEKGSFYQKNDRGNFEFLHDGKMAIIAPEYHGNKLTFVLTAYKTRKKGTA